MKKNSWFRNTGDNELKMNRSSDENEHRMNKTYFFLIQEKERLNTTFE